MLLLIESIILLLCMVGAKKMVQNFGKLRIRGVLLLDKMVHLELKGEKMYMALKANAVGLRHLIHGQMTLEIKQFQMPLSTILII